MANLTESLLELKRLEAGSVAASTRLMQLEQEIGQAKYRLSLKDEVDSAMLAIQERNHQRMVGMYESLLTEINREVIGGEKVVKLELYTHGGRPSMDIYMENDGNPESIMNGTGGAVSNVISVGLRFIALSRIDRRKFIVLDEADCWLASERIPFFANIVSKMGKELGFQILMISHHPQSYFYEAANTIIQLSKGDNAVRVTPIKQAPEEVRDDQIASIHLLNFMSHADSLIPLGAGMTMLQAENDVGKSAIVTALDAITTGSFKKEYIRHDSEYAEVTLTMTDGRSLVCRRVSKTGRNDKYSVAYRMYGADGTMMHEAPVKDEMPAWALDFMGIRPEQDLDIQIGNQRTPVFLLQESPAKRASILSIGGEISHIAAMQSAYKDRVSKDKKIASDGEPEVGRLRKIVMATMRVPGLISACSDLQSRLASIERTRAELVEIDKLIAKIGRIDGAQNIRLPAIPALPDVPDTAPMAALCRRLSAPDINLAPLPSWPSFSDLAPLDTLFVKLGRAEPKLPSIPIFPVVSDLSDIDSLIHRTRKVPVPQLPAPPVFPEVASAEKMRDMDSIIYRLEALRDSGKMCVQQANEAKVEMQAAALEINALIDESNGVCDACGGLLEKMEVHQHQHEGAADESRPSMH